MSKSREWLKRTIASPQGQRPIPAVQSPTPMTKRRIRSPLLLYEHLRSKQSLKETAFSFCVSAFTFIKQWKKTFLVCLNSNRFFWDGHHRRSIWKLVVEGLRCGWPRQRLGGRDGGGDGGGWRQRFHPSVFSKITKISLLVFITRSPF